MSQRNAPGPHDLPSASDRAHKAVLIAIGLTIAELDIAPSEVRGADNVLRRVYENLQRFYTTSTMTPAEKTAGQALVETLQHLVDDARRTMRNNP